MNFELERKPATTRMDLIKTIILIVIVSFSLFSIFLVINNVNPIFGWSQLIRMGFVLKYQTTITRTVPILLATLAFLVPLKADVWNIGVNGQFIVGGIASTGIAFLIPDIDSAIALPLMFIGAALAGAGFAGIVGAMKIKWNANEVVLTLMLNFVALKLVKFLVINGPWTTPEGRTETEFIPHLIPKIGGFLSDVPYTLLVALGITALAIFMIKKTTFGYEVTTLGESSGAAQYAGISRGKIIMLTMLISGAMAGVCGFHQSAGVALRLHEGIAHGWGFLGLTVGLAAGGSLIAGSIFAFVFTGLMVGTGAFQTLYSNPSGSADLFIGLVLLSAVTCQFLRYYSVKIEGLEGFIEKLKEE